MDKGVEEADKKLDQAVEEYMSFKGWNSSGVLTSWILVGHQLSYDEDGDMIDTYPFAVKGGQQSRHVNIGLLHALLDFFQEDRFKFEE